MGRGGAANDFFGNSVAVDADTMVVGAYQQDTTSAGTDSGLAYVYVRSDKTWTEQAQLTASDGAATDFFGFCVAASGNTIAVGAYQDDTTTGFDSGSVYVFARSGSRWSEQAKIVADDGAMDDRMGFSVAIDEDTIVIGAPGDDTYRGSVYVYVREGNDWTKQAKLTATEGTTDDYFGGTVAISGDTLVAGAIYDDGSSETNTGAAYVYFRLGTSWTEQARLEASDGVVDDRLGFSVAIDGDNIVVGAQRDDTDNGFDTGSAYVYRRAGNRWTEQAKLTAGDGASEDFYGGSVAIAGDSIVVGAVSDDDTSSVTNSGSVYVYYLSDDGWTQQAKLKASDGAANDFSFGASVSISENTVVVGANQADSENGENSGAAYVF